jgi:hypothetical protein
VWDDVFSEYDTSPGYVSGTKSLGFYWEEDNRVEDAGSESQLPVGRGKLLPYLVSSREEKDASYRLVYDETPPFVRKISIPPHPVKRAQKSAHIPDRKTVVSRKNWARNDHVA